MSEKILSTCLVMNVERERSWHKTILYSRDVLYIEQKLTVATYDGIMICVTDRRYDLR